MIKLTFEGATIGEVNESIQTYSGSSASGSAAGVVGAATETGKKKTAAAAAKEEKLTLEKIQLKCSSVVENATDKPAAKAAIKEAMEEFMVKKVTELEESEFPAFMAKLEEI